VGLYLSMRAVTNITGDFGKYCDLTSGEVLEVSVKLQDLKPTSLQCQDPSAAVRGIPRVHCMSRVFARMLAMKGDVCRK
jgi:hypothetical protein